MNKEEAVIASFPFLEGDSKWAGAVEVIKTVATTGDGKMVQIHLQLRIGQRSVRLPRNRGFAEIVEAIRLGMEEATNRYAEAIREMNKK